MRIDMPTFKKIDRLFDPAVPLDDVRGALSADNWQVVQAACNALGNRRDTGAVELLLDVLRRQDELDIYGAPDMWSLDDAPDEETKELWRCRFRVKQAACLALGEIGEEHGAQALGEETIQHLSRYATDDNEDYVIRAAACQALGRAGAAIAEDVLKRAAEDGEWCTRTEARKALAGMGSV